LESIAIASTQVAEKASALLMICSGEKATAPDIVPTGKVLYPGAILECFFLFPRENYLNNGACDQFAETGESRKYRVKRRNIGNWLKRNGVKHRL
jgi:hypothetical protein